jgi:prolyl oligopeptidase
MSNYSFREYTNWPGHLATAILLCVGVASVRTYAAEDSLSRVLKYPTTKRVEHVDTYHGTVVADPYRWLEDPDSADTKAWVEAQNKVTFGFLEDIQGRPRIRERLTELWNYERYGVPFREGERYFISKNDGLQNQNVLYTMSSLDGEPKLLLDPNKLSSDGTMALSGYAVTDDGKFMAYGLSSAGSDWQEWKVRDVETKQDLQDHIQWVKFNGSNSQAHPGRATGKVFFIAAMTSPARRPNSRH